jgi:TetR/AcrR family transcriptional regulator, regulator of autoinduction and epiphytic fitness
MPAANLPLDGRVARSHRTREAVVDALLDLINEGDLQPTAARIAERAKVSLRLVFHHFNDLETIYAALAKRQLERVAPLMKPAISPSMPLASRIGEFVAQRARTLEFIAPVRRAALLREPFTPSLANQLAGARTLARRQIQTCFAAELDACEGAERRELLHALDIALSWDAWDMMRRQQGLSESEARRVMDRIARTLLIKHN